VTVKYQGQGQGQGQVSVQGYLDILFVNFSVSCTYQDNVVCVVYFIAKAFPGCCGTSCSSVISRLLHAYTYVDPNSRTYTVYGGMRRQRLRYVRIKCVALRCGAARCVDFAATCRNMPQYAATLHAVYINTCLQPQYSSWRRAVPRGAAITASGVYEPFVVFLQKADQLCDRDGK